MEIFVDENLQPMAGGIILSLLTILFGFSLGGIFGALESGFKPWLRAKGEKVLDSVYGGDRDKLESSVNRGWKYAIRGHLHGGALGTSGLVAILLLALLGEPGWFEILCAWALGAGGLLYSAYWIMAGFRVPVVGNGKEAKESLWWIAMPGAGLCLGGLAGTILAFIIAL
jgi:hypothetical protein